MEKPILISSLFLGCLLTASGASELPLIPPATVDETRLSALEARVKFIEKKLTLLSTETDQELNGVSTVMGSPALLKQQADYALKVEKSPERAYRYLGILRALHPESPESKSSYGIAVALFKQLYFKNRYNPSGAMWTTVEPFFIFQWTADFFVSEAPAFPTREVEALLIGAPGDMVRRFEAFAASNTAMQRWSVGFTDDNGIVETITARLK